MARQVVPIINGIQRFDEIEIPFRFDANTATTSSFDYISESLRRNAGPELENLMIWGDNENKFVATQRPPIKRSQVYC